MLVLVIVLMFAGSLFAMGEQVQKNTSTEDHSAMNMEQAATGNMKMDNMDMGSKDHDMKGMDSMHKCH